MPAFISLWKFKLRIYYHVTVLLLVRGLLDAYFIHVLEFRSNYEVAELTWKNGQLAMHGFSGLLPTNQTKPTWSRAHDTLESIVQQGTCQYQNSNFMAQSHTPTSVSSTVAPSCGTGAENSAQGQTVPVLTKKRTRSDSDYCGRNLSSNTKIVEECDPSACASASATFCRDNDTTMMTWASFESGRSLKSKTLDEDSPCHCASENRDQDEDRDTKGEIGRSHSTRRNRAADIHNQSERRRRDRINQRMKALQRLVPNASKTDKASMLDEVIEYLKQLQAQIQMMNMRNMPQMMMPLAMQQQFQMSMLARMGVGLGLGMGMLNMNTMAARAAAPHSLPQLIQPATVGAPASAPTFVAPSFMMHPLFQAHAPPALPKPEPVSAAANASVSLPDPYGTMLGQSVNMDLLNSMAALYRQQISQNNQVRSSLAQHHEKGG